MSRGAGASSWLFQHRSRQYRANRCASKTLTFSQVRHVTRRLAIVLHYVTKAVEPNVRGHVAGVRTVERFVNAEGSRLLSIVELGSANWLVANVMLSSCPDYVVGAAQESRPTVDIRIIPDSPRRRAIGGFMRLSSGKEEPFEAVIVYEDGHTSHHPFGLLMEGEAFLRSHNSMRWPPEPLRAAPPPPP